MDHLVVVTTGSLVGEGEEEEEEEEEEGTTSTTMEEGEEGEEGAGPMTGGTDTPTYFRRLRTDCKTE